MRSSAVEADPTQMTRVPRLLKSRSTWSLILSAVALVLSQAPPISHWFSGERITVHLSRNITIGHSIGSLLTRFGLEIRNTGGRTIEVTSIDCFLKKSSGERYDMPISALSLAYGEPNGGQVSTVAYESEYSAEVPYSMTTIVLKPTQRWSYAVTGYTELTESEDQKVSEIREAIYDSIGEQAAKTKMIDMQNFEAEPVIVQRAIDCFQSHFTISQGQYTFVVALKSHNNRIVATVAYPIVIYAYQIDALRSVTKQYKYGSGILYNGQAPRGLNLILRSPLSAEDARRIYATK